MLTDYWIVDSVMDGGHHQLNKVDLAIVKRDFVRIIAAAPHEVPALVNAFNDGAIDGSSYIGDCCCLVGTIAKLQNTSFDCIPGIVPNYHRMAERFVSCIESGDTPRKNPNSAICVQWCEEFLATLPVHTLVDTTTAEGAEL